MREVVDAITGLTDACTAAAAGEQDIEQLMSHAKSLRTAVAQLVTAAESKLRGGSAAHAALLETLRSACKDITVVSNHLFTDVRGGGAPGRGPFCARGAHWPG